MNELKKYKYVCLFSVNTRRGTSRIASRLSLHRMLHMEFQVPVCLLTKYKMNSNKYAHSGTDKDRLVSWTDH